MDQKPQTGTPKGHLVLVTVALVVVFLLGWAWGETQHETAWSRWNPILFYRNLQNLRWSPFLEYINPEATVALAATHSKIISGFIAVGSTIALRDPRARVILELLPSLYAKTDPTSPHTAPTPLQIQNHHQNPAYPTMSPYSIRDSTTLTPNNTEPVHPQIHNGPAWQGPHQAAPVAMQPRTFPPIMPIPPTGCEQLMMHGGPPQQHMLLPRPYGGWGTTMPYYENQFAICDDWRYREKPMFPNHRHGNSIPNITYFDKQSRK